MFAHLLLKRIKWFKQANDVGIFAKQKCITSFSWMKLYLMQTQFAQTSKVRAANE